MIKNKIRHLWDFAHFILVFMGLVYTAKLITDHSEIPFFITSGILILAYTGVSYFYLGIDLGEIYGIGFYKKFTTRNTSTKHIPQKG